MKITINKYLCGTLLLILPSALLTAQQSTDVDKWRQEDADRIARHAAFYEAKEADPGDVNRTGPDYIVYTPQGIGAGAGDLYNDHFQVFDKPDGTMFALWTQATIEGALDQHVVLSRSTDKGWTWSDPQVIAGPSAEEPGKPIASWGFPLVSRSGRIYVIYNQYNGHASWLRQHTGLMTGIYSDDDGLTWSDPQVIPMPRTTNDHYDHSVPAEWVVWQKPLRLAAGDKYFVGMTRYLNPKLHYNYRTVTEFLRFENIDEDPAVRDIRIAYFMNNDKVMNYGRRCEEPATVKLPDGRLFTLLRTDSGFPVWSVADGDGEPWSIPRPLLGRDGKPYPHPLSPGPIYDFGGPDAASGLYYAFVHNLGPSEPGSGYPRGPLYLIAGRFVPGADQPIQFGEPRLFIDRPFEWPYGNSMYSSTSVVDGELVLWYPDQKYYLLGRKIGPEWFTEVTAAVPVIFDTDMGPDYDDVGALTMLHALADSGEARILATVSCNLYPLAAPCIDVINTYYGRPDIPIGAPKAGVNIGDDWHKIKWTEALVNNFPHKVRSTADTPPAVEVYRKVLAEQPDTSVVVISVGWLTNLADLLASGPDEYSPLDGEQLVKMKVKHLVAMAGHFPRGREWNVHCDSTASVIAFANWPTPVIFSGFEIGEEIRTGKELISSDIEKTPAKVAYRVCLENRPNDARGRQSWDQTAVLAAVRGTDRYFGLTRGTIEVAANGSNTWRDNPEGPHAYITFLKPAGELRREIESLMIHRKK